MIDVQEYKLKKQPLAWLQSLQKAQVSYCLHPGARQADQICPELAALPKGKIWLVMA